MARRRKTYDDDDGRVIANMNVEGMPWYREGADDPAPEGGERMSRAETRMFVWRAVWIAVGFGVVFSAAMILVIQLMIWAWT